MPIALALGAALYDWRRREIPDGFAVALLVWALGSTLYGAGDLGPGARLAGVCLGAAAGGALFALGVWGGGDAKLVTALGAVLGAPGLAAVLILGGVLGGALCCVAWLRGRRDVAYSPAVAGGLLLYVARGGGGLHAI